jgi:hypothetical protein
MTDHAAAVEEIRKRHRAVDGAPLASWGALAEQAHRDRATLLRAYEAMVKQRDDWKAQPEHVCPRCEYALMCDANEQLTTLRAQHAALTAECEGLRKDMLAAANVALKWVERERKLQTALGAAREFMQHREWCLQQGMGRPTCECGLSQLLATLGEPNRS